MDNPNIAAQERHNNREYLPFTFVDKPNRGCKECGEWKYGKAYPNGLCEDCTETSEAITRAELLTKRNLLRTVKVAQKVRTRRNKEAK